MTNRSLLIALGAGLLTACGVANGQIGAETAAAASSSEPEIGEKIGTGATAGMAREAAIAAEDAAKAEARAAAGLRELGWEELMPEGEEERLAQLYQQQMMMLYSGEPVEEGSAADAMVQIGTFNTVPELDGQRVRIPGYTVPFDFSADARITEFLLVPYFGACIHAPPPPPNQTIFVMTEDPLQIRDLAQAVWIDRKSVV